MNTKPSLPHHTSMTSLTLQVAQKHNDVLLFVVIFVIALGLTPLLVLAGATAGISLLLGSLAILTGVALIIRWPIAGFYIVVGLVTLVEQEPLSISTLTDRLPVFYWPASLEGMIERPIGLLFIFIFLVFVGQRLLRRQRPLWGGPLLVPFSLFLLCIVGGVIHGLTSRGDLKMILLEVRPLWYLFVSYLLAYNLVTHKDHVRALLWIGTLDAGVKAVQGIYIYLVVLHGDLTNQNTLMAHEESFFFAALLLLVMLFYLHHRYRPQFSVALPISVGVLIALIGNQRRAAYIALLLGMGVVWALIFWVKPHARKWLVLGVLACAVLGMSYIALFAQSTAAFAKPAHAIVSVFFPDPTDVAKFDSNLYRTVEDHDLIYTVKQDPFIGLGFGKPFLQPVPLTSIYPNVLADDPIYNYVPHNTIYWIWMRLGAIGFFALWYLFGSIIVRGCLIVRQLKDPYLQLAAIYIIGVTFMEIIVAFADYQLYSFRNVIYVGLLAGVLMRLPALDTRKGTSHSL